jgi:hypothetical protein
VTVDPDGDNRRRQTTTTTAADKSPAMSNAVGDEIVTVLSQAAGLNASGR